MGEAVRTPNAISISLLAMMRSWIKCRSMSGQQSSSLPELQYCDLSIIWCNGMLLMVNHSRMNLKHCMRCIISATTNRCWHITTFAKEMLPESSLALLPFLLHLCLLLLLAQIRHLRRSLIQKLESLELEWGLHF